MRRARRPDEAELDALLAEAYLDPTRTTFAVRDVRLHAQQQPALNDALAFQLERRAAQEARGMIDALCGTQEQAWIPRAMLQSRLTATFVQNRPAEIEPATALAWPWAQLAPPVAAPPAKLVVVYPSPCTEESATEFARALASVFDWGRFGRFDAVAVRGYVACASVEHTAAHAASAVGAAGEGALVVLLWPLGEWATVRHALAACPPGSRVVAAPLEASLGHKRRMARLLRLCVGAHATLMDGRGPVEVPWQGEPLALACFVSAPGAVAAALCDASGSRLLCRLVRSGDEGGGAEAMREACNWACSQAGGASLCIVADGVNAAMVRGPCLIAPLASPHEWTRHGDAAAAAQPDAASAAMDGLALLATATEFPARSIASVNVSAYADGVAATWRLPLFIRAARLLAGMVPS